MINIELNTYLNSGVTDYSFGDSSSRIRRMLWKTDVVTFDNGKIQRNQIFESPIRQFALNYQWMREGVRNKFLELFQRAKGRYESFLFLYEDDNICTYTDWSYALTTGDTTTQLQKTYYVGETEEWTENKTKIVPSSIYAPTLKVQIDSSTQLTLVEGVDYTLNDLTGIVTWITTSAGYTPATGHVLTADYKFYFEVMFDVDVYEDVEHQIDWWSVEGIQLIEVK
jgi:uncharacterized protein (TIGR02217 family)